MIITDGIRYVGVNDHETDLFEGQYRIPDGMAYNSYLIMDEQIAVMDSVDARFCGEWLANIDRAAEGRQPDYLIVQHMEPDHSGSIAGFMSAYPQAKLVTSAKARVMLNSFFGTDFGDRLMQVGEGDTLSLGGRSLSFIAAPMVHWPEVIMTYDDKDRALFSADAFGTFGALDVPAGDWAAEARRYYIGIVGKYGVQVQSVLKKAAGLDIRLICPLHGPALKENLSYYLSLYNTWSSYAAEEEGVAIAYTSIYGHTKAAVLLLAEKLQARGCPHVAIHDLARCDTHEALADVFRYSRTVLATTTYNGGVFPHMREFLCHLGERNFSGRTVGIIENGSWAPMADKLIREGLAKCKNLTFAQNSVKIISALNDESAARLEALAEELWP